MKFKNIIFDLDGTLVDSAVITMTAFRRIAPDFGLDAPDLPRLRTCIGYANPEFYYRVYPEQDSETVQRLGAMVERLELELLDGFNEDLLFPGCGELLNRFERLGTSMYIASTGSNEHVTPILHKTKITRYFKRVLCGEPDKSEMVRKIIENGDNSTFVMVGDMEKDSQAAHDNGIFSIGACYGYCVRGQKGFDNYINTPTELLKFL